MTDLSNIKMISGDEVYRLLSPAVAVAAIEAALEGGLNPANDLPRTFADVDKGQFLLMPSGSKEATGIKVVTIAPENPSIGQPRIQGLYLLFDPITLTPTAIIDGAAITAIRTPAISIAAVHRALQLSAEPLDVVVFGTGPQGLAHVQTLAGTVAGTREISSVTFIARDAAKAAAQVGSNQSLGLGESTKVSIVAGGSEAAVGALAQASVVVAATTAREPLFDSSVLRDNAIVIAVGSHEPEARELDSALMGRAQVIVETKASALREYGDVIQAVDDGSLAADALIEMSDTVTGRVALMGDRPVVFKSAGMSWQDLVVAQAVVAAG